MQGMLATLTTTRQFNFSNALFLQTLNLFLADTLRMHVLPSCKALAAFPFSLFKKGE